MPKASDFLRYLRQAATRIEHVQGNFLRVQLTEKLLQIFPNNDLADLTFVRTVYIFCKFVGNIVEIAIFCHSSLSYDNEPCLLFCHTNGRNKEASTLFIIKCCFFGLFSLCLS